MRKNLLLNLLVLVAWYGALAQSGQIEGIIKDSKTKETLVGAQILVEGTTIGAVTNLNGEFVINNVPQGYHTLFVSYISYEPLYVEQVEVSAGRSSSLVIELHETNITISGVTVTARRTTHSEVALLNSIRSGQVVVSGISAQQISRSQDSDAAEVVRRIPGVTVMNDRFIIVRGLSERYNPVRLHAMNAPSMEADIRSFSFDMIPSSQIDRLLIHKSPAPDLPGDFAGGMIRIYTRSIPDRTSFQVGYSTGYQQGTSFNTMQITERNNSSWLGLGESYFHLPEGFPDDIRTITNNPDALTEAGRSLKNNWVPSTKTAPLDQSFSLSAAFRMNPRNIDVGNITTLSYSNSYSLNQIARSDFNAYNHQQDVSLPIYRFNDAQHNNNIKIGLLHNWGIRFNDNHSVEVINLYNHISSYRYVNRLGDHLDFGFIMNNHAFQQVFRGLYSGQVNGTHRLSENTEVDWSAGLSNSFRNMPDYKQYRSERPINDADADYFNIYVPIGGAQPYFMGRFYSEMQEDGFAYGANIRQKVQLGSNFTPELRAGVFVDHLERYFRARNIGYTQAVGFDQGLRAVSVDSLFHPEHINNFGGIKLDEQSNPQDSYDASNSLYAAYLALHIPFNKFELYGGLRWEQNHRILNSATTEGPVELDKTDKHLLPSINLTYNFTNQLLLRGAFGKTLNRPEFRENAPFGFFDFDYNHVVTGFPYLQTAIIDNYDLRLEYYPSVSEVISLSFFYKDFSNAIERVFLPGAGSGGAKNFSFGNADHARIIGGETEIRKSFAGIFDADLFNSLFVVVNATLLRSTVDIGKGTRSQGRDTDPRALQGQSPYIFNAGIFYNNIERNLQISILYNIIGKRIYSGGFRELDGI
ncbi:MAG: TonB-dependent receptor, partial [Bacteroidales bacterium]|nr:TonB-dependent receptor [Bacteroidales bacterium]